MLPQDPALLALLLGLVFFVAVAYSSVGHGGASGYLAVLSFFGLAPVAMAPSALCLNLLVAGTSFSSYWRAGHFAFRLLWPFLLTSIPFAFLGGLTEVSPKTYMLLLAAVLIFAAYRLLAVVPPKPEESFLRVPPLGVALPVGAGIGFLSGIIGVGGGIFLSPLLILLRWADAKRTAAVSAAFIWVNSAAGLYGHLSRKDIDWSDLAWLVGFAFAGGLVGSYLGARRFRGLWLRRILGVVLLVATVKLLRTAF
ncbi:sulfite exporter TauE/SafE family protein [Acidobacteriia bacterium AH_259_A11_L15]|nr:sulfite exporter TauE/SafE family protein [Acidobacteriia bacterium AH_259_A11_L15]